MEELLPRSKDRCFFFLNILVLVAVCDLHGKFPVTVLMLFNKSILLDVESNKSVLWKDKGKA